MNTYLLYPTSTSQVGQHVKCLTSVSSSFDHIHTLNQKTFCLSHQSSWVGSDLPFSKYIQLYHFSGLCGFLLGDEVHLRPISNSYKYFSNAKASPNRRGTYLAHLAWLRAWQSSWYLNSCSGMTLLTASFSFCRGSLKRSSWGKKNTESFFKHIYKTYFASRSSEDEIWVLDIDHTFEMLAYSNMDISSKMLTFHNAHCI